MPTSLPPPNVGVTDTIPLGEATGSAHSVHFFGWRRFGDDTTEAAIADAKKGNQDLDLIDPLVDRRVHCFPACNFAFITIGETTVTGTLARYKRMPDYEKPEAAKTEKLRLGKAPPIENLVERLIHLYGDDPKSAGDFYGSLAKETREQIEDQVVSGMGVLSQNGTFRIPKDAPPERKQFLVWFVETYTTYQPLGE